MMMPDQLFLGLAVVCISVAFSNKSLVNARQSKTKVLRIEPTENPGMRAAQNQPSTGDEDALYFRKQGRPILLGNMLDDLDARHALELAIGKWELKPVSLSYVSVRQFRLGPLDSVMVDIDSGQLHLRIPPPEIAKKFSCIAP